MGTWRLAIDFGTSNSAAAIQIDGREPQSVRLTDSGDIMPSAVFESDQAYFAVYERDADVLDVKQMVEQIK